MTTADPLSRMASTVSMLARPLARWWHSSEDVQYALVRLGIKTNPRDDFQSVYSHALARYRVGHPIEFVALFRLPSIRSAFEDSLLNADPAILDARIQDAVNSPEGADIVGGIDVDIRQGVRAFTAIFQGLSGRLRTPRDIASAEAIARILDERLPRILQTALASQDRAPAQYPSGARRPSGSTPPSLPDYYVPRTELLQQVRDFLVSPRTPGDSTPRRIALTGPAGVGKTILVQAILQSSPVITAPASRHVLWASLGPSNDSRAVSDEALEEWLRHLGLSPAEFPTIPARVQAIRSSIAGQDSILVVDDVWSSDAAAPLFECAAADTVCILTTRDRELPPRLGIPRTIEIGAMLQPEARRLIELRLGRSLPDGEWISLVAPVAELLEGLPLALSLAAAQVASRNAQWTQLRDALGRVPQPDALDFRRSAAREESLTTSLDLTLNSLDSDTQRRALWLASSAPAPFIFAEDVAMLWSGIDPGQRPQGNDPRAHAEWMQEQRRETYETLLALRRVGLVELDANYALVRLHAVVHGYLLSKLSQSDQLHNAIHHHAWVYFSLIVTDNPLDAANHVYRFAGAQVIEVLARAWATLRHEEAPIRYDSVEFALSLMLPLVQTLSTYWATAGSSTEASTWLPRAIEVARERGDLAAEHGFLGSLVQLEQTTGRLDDAKAHALQALEIAQRLQDSDSEIGCQLDIAKVDIAMKSFDSAEKLLLECRSACDRPDKQHQLGLVLGTLGTLYIQRGQLDLATECLEQALKVARSEEDPVALATRLGNLGNMHMVRAQEAHSRALDLLIDSRRLARLTGNRLSEANKDYAIARVYLAKGEIALARLCFNLALPVYEEIGAPVSRDVKLTLSKLDEDPSQPNVEVILRPEMFQLTLEAVRGDRLADARIRPFLEHMATREMPQLPELQLSISRLLLILKGERNPETILEGVQETVLSLSLQTLLLEILQPGSGSFYNGVGITLRAAMRGEEGGLPNAEALKRTLEVDPSQDDQLRGLISSCDAVLHGERNVGLVTRTILHGDARRLVRTILEADQLPEYTRASFYGTDFASTET